MSDNEKDEEEQDIVAKFFLRLTAGTLGLNDEDSETEQDIS